MLTSKLDQTVKLFWCAIWVHL